MKLKPTRREMLENCVVRGLLLAAAPMSASRLLAAWQQAQAQANTPTPTVGMGPFYKKNAPNTSTLRQPGDPGFPLRVSGNVLNTRGEAVSGARLDIWHADHQGRYDLQGYRYRAKLLVESASGYALETILPGHYPDRPAQHIHCLITAPGHKTLITQLYFATDPWFEGDVNKNYAKRGIVSNRDLVRPVTLYDEPGAARAAVTFDIVLEKA